MKLKLLPFLISSCLTLASQSHSHLEIPLVLKEFSYSDCQLTLSKNAQQLKELGKKDAYNYSNFSALARGADTGLEIDLKKSGFNGSVAYGPYNTDAEFPTVSFLPKTVKLIDGKVLLELKSVFTKANDFFKLAEKAEGIIGYRIMDNEGRIVYEGRCAFTGKGPYKVLPAINEGPFVNVLDESGCLISFETQTALKTKIAIGTQSFEDEQASKHHEIKLSGLQASTQYTYQITYGERKDNFKFTTAAKAGSRTAFTFAFASANRANTGGGEKDFGGTNYQTTRAIMAAALQYKAVFMQNMGDITNGGNAGQDGHLLEYANFKRALEPFWSKVPVYLGFGDHEVNYYAFEVDTVVKKSAKIDRFPYATESGEASFAKAFVHPQNGPDSEDGAVYDPNNSSIDFPTYKENVYSYTYDNVAMIVLNTEYWKAQDPKVSGSPEGYIMDIQLKWLSETIQKFENDGTIDHIFVNVHSAVFPNGDHANGAMWYDGS
ncbi:MAG: fibronectin type III domain-containing protein, partial [Bacteroidota bacterium]